MKTNNLLISINKPLHKVFMFTITPPNSKYWIPDIINEEANELPIKIGTIYKLTNKTGESFRVTVTDFMQDTMIEWISEDKKYHCKYTYTAIDENTCKLEYYEWTDKGELDEPFTLTTLEKLKSIIENI